MMTRDNYLQVEAIIRVSPGAVGAMTNDEVSFAAAARRFLTQDGYPRALAILAAEAIELGLIQRDGDGRFLTTIDVEPAGPPAAGEGGKAIDRSPATRAPQAVSSSPSPLSVRAMTKAKQELYAEIFATKVGGRDIGGYRHSELYHAEKISERDARIFARVRKYSQPVRDAAVADYFPGDKLSKILKEESDRASQH